MPTQDCNLALLAFINTTVYSSGTGGEGTACALTVSGLGGGVITVAVPNSAVLFQQPNTFQILFNGVSPSSPYGGVSQVFDVATGTVSQAAGLPQPDGEAAFPTAATLLPTVNVILSFGDAFLPGSSSSNAFNNTFTFSYTIASGTWRQTGSFAVEHGFGGLVTLHDGSALAVGGLYTPTCEIFSLSAGTWTPTGSLSGPRGSPGTAVLLTGEVSRPSSRVCRRLSGKCAWQPGRVAQALPAGATQIFQG